MVIYQRNDPCVYCVSKVYYDPRKRNIFCKCGKTNQHVADFTSWTNLWDILGDQKFKKVDNRNMFQNQANNYPKTTQ